MGLAGVAPRYQAPPGPPHALTLRPVTPQDLALTYAITRDAMRGYVEQTWGAWDEGDQRRKHRDSFTPQTHRIIEMESVPGPSQAAGLVAAEPWPDDPRCVWLVKLYLRAGFRGRGFGSQVLGDLVQQAAAARRPLRLRVLRVNTRAQALYLRHGFSVFEETAERLFMERKPGGVT